jgi:hypothetical protein
MAEKQLVACRSLKFETGRRFHACCLALVNIMRGKADVALQKWEHYEFRSSMKAYGAIVELELAKHVDESVEYRCLLAKKSMHVFEVCHMSDFANQVRRPLTLGSSIPYHSLNYVRM